jgi:hypothetical protein
MISEFISSYKTSDKIIFYNELKVKHLKTIYKTLVGENLDYNIVFLNFKNILKEITSLKEKEIQKLTFLDYFLLLLEIRCTSIGNLIYTQSLEKANTKIEININKFTTTLLDFKDKTNDYFFNNVNNIQIYYTLPSIDDIFNKKVTDQFYTNFLKKIVINNTNIELTDITEDAKNKILEQLPAKVTSQIFKTISSIVDKLNSINLLSSINGLEDKVLYFNLDIENLISVIKILFGEQLLTLYENIFMLSKIGNLPPEYIENCTPGEYILFVKKLDAFINQNNSHNNDFVPDEAFNPINNDLV